MPKPKKSPAHTQVEWRLYKYAAGDIYEIQKMNVHGFWAARAKFDVSASGPELLKDAVLMAAAPDLLAFARDFLDFVDDPNMDMGELKGRAKAAILKAEGGSPA